MTSISQDSELTFEQQQEVDRLSALANTPSSNQNKHRYNLYAYIDSVIATATRQAVKEELETLKNICMMDNVSVSGINRVIGTHIARLTQSNSQELEGDV